MAIDRGQGISTTPALAESYDVGNLVEEATDAKNSAQSSADTATTKASEASASATSASASAATATTEVDKIEALGATATNVAVGGDATASYTLATGTLTLGLGLFFG